jgi:hypothetical protein
VIFFFASSLSLTLFFTLLIFVNLLFFVKELCQTTQFCSNWLLTYSTFMFFRSSIFGPKLATRLSSSIQALAFFTTWLVFCSHHRSLVIIEPSSRVLSITSTCLSFMFNLGLNWYLSVKLNTMVLLLLSFIIIFFIVCPLADLVQPIL